jgi:hypothetical protein
MPIRLPPMPSCKPGWLGVCQSSHEKTGSVNVGEQGRHGAFWTISAEFARWDREVGEPWPRAGGVVMEY